MEVLRRLRRRSLAALRQDVEPVDPQAYGRFLPAWQHVGQSLRGLDGVAAVVEQLAGAAVPASALEQFILPSRVRDYAPAMLDELTSTGEVTWSGAGSLPGHDGWIALHLAETSPLTLQLPAADAPTALQHRLLDLLSGGGAYFFRQLMQTLQAAPDAGESPPPADAEVTEALWGLVWAGRVSNDTFAPVRGLLAGGKTAHRQKPGAPRARLARTALRGSRLSGRPGPAASGLAGATGLAGAPGLTAGARATRPAALAATAGRWTLLPAPEPDATVRAHAAAEVLLDRYGVLTRGAVAAEGTPGGFALMYKVLARLEESGHCRRGYFIEHLGAAQFAVPATVDRLRSFSRDRPEGTAGHGAAGQSAAVALAATDPANPYGAALAWPQSETGHRPGRKAGALVVLVDGALVLYVERGGKTLLTFTDNARTLEDAAGALTSVLRGSGGKMAVEKANSEPVLGSEAGRALEAAGFYSTPKGLRFRA
jgi:ATP-dependent Lhr-like helicase